MIDYNIGNVLEQVALKMQDKRGLVAPRKGGWQSWSFQELAAITNYFVGELHELGIKKGDRVMLMVRPSVEFICLTFSLFQLGAVVILIDPGMGYKNLLRCIGAVMPDILIGIPTAIYFSAIFRKPFVSLRTRVCVGPSLLWRGACLERIEDSIPQSERSGVPHFKAGVDDLAAIIFTTGSTGPPKGVQYTHGIFHAQLELIRDYFGIGAGDVDQPGFPLFGLFSIALGATAVIPDMDPTRPAKVDPGKFVSSIVEHGVTYSFGSPAIWNVVSRYCLENDVKLPVEKILMAGAPVPGTLIKSLQQLMGDNAEIFTPYGATESLPIAAIEGHEVTGETWEQTRHGRGTCVGRPLPGITIKVITPCDDPVSEWGKTIELPLGEIGEIVVKGAVVTRAYDSNTHENVHAKIKDGKTFWHRMGDMGYFDEQGRLWFCGRKAHRVFTDSETLYTIPCEAIFNEHPAVFRSALVGVGKIGKQRPVLIVELKQKSRNHGMLFQQLKGLAAANTLTQGIETFLVHPGFPVDIRHNAKIFREQLALWAKRKVGCYD